MENNPLLDYLRQKGVQALADEFHVSVKRHPVYPHLVHLKYDQIETPRNDVTNRCRGCVVNENDNFNYVCRPYNRFFNYGEGHAAEINWSRATVLEKLDGSLCPVWFYNGEWHVSTSGTPDAGGPVNIGLTTFKDLFWNVWKQLGYKMPINQDLTYCFELMTPYNRVIVKIDKPRIVLHGCICNSSGQEFDIGSIARNMGWEVCPFLPLNNFDAILTAADKLNPMESEGYVVVDHLFNRVKVKSPQYVALSHLKDSMSARRMVDIVRMGESSEFLSYFSEYELLYIEIKSRYDKLVSYLETIWENSKNIVSQKDFAFAVKDKNFASVLFGYRAGKCDSIRNGLRNCNLKHLTEYLSDGLDVACLITDTGETV
jgi:hypothetical protein